VDRARSAYTLSMETVVIVTAEVGRPSAAARAVRRAGFRVALRDLHGALDEVALDMPDVLVVEVPDGVEPASLVARLAAGPDLADVPIVVVVSLGQIAGLARVEGIADFCLRPVSEEELVARVRRQLRAPGRSDDDVIRVGSLAIDLRGHEARVSDRALDLAYQEFELLRFFASHPGQAFSRDQLLARVWGYDYYGGSRTVDIHVRRIRAKLGPIHAACLCTVRHVGYKWTPSPESEA